MKLLRIKLTQRKAHFGRPECIDNRITYPLPPYSTVIGALHTACEYEEYHLMDISIQGKYESISNDIKRYENMLNGFEDDRGILIYRPNTDVFKYVKVAEAIVNKERKTKISYLEKTGIKIYNNDLLDDFIKIKKIANNYGLNKVSKEKLKKILSEIESKQNDCEVEKRLFSVKLLENFIKNNYVAEMNKKYYIKDIDNIVKSIKAAIKCYNYAIMQPYLVKIETLNNLELVIHVKADDLVLNEIIKNKNNLVCLGRSEDFIELKEMKIVDATDEIDKEYKLTNNYQMFINRNVFEHKKVNGTIYFLNKNYEIKEKRVFSNIPALLTSDFSVKERTKNILVDDEYIINLN